jgi:hypothetical protein
MQIKNQPPQKIAYVTFLGLLLSYYAYCQYNGHGMFYFASSQNQQFAARGVNGFQHK